MSLIAINVCMVCNSFDTAAIPLSCSLCPVEDETWDSSIAYRLVSLAEKKLQKGYGHAHITVVQLCVRATNLAEVKETVRQIWAKHREAAVAAKEKLVLTKIEAGPVFTTLDDGTEVRLPSIAVERSDTLLSLHTEIMEALKPYAVQLGSMEVGKATFHKTFPAETAMTVKWMIDYFTNSAGQNYHPHITLGASPIKRIDELTYFQPTRVPWRECRLVISHMGNYGSCFELLD